MKKQKISWILAAAYLLAAGMCGGCAGAGGEESVLLLEEPLSAAEGEAGSAMEGEAGSAAEGKVGSAMEGKVGSLVEGEAGFAAEGETASVAEGGAPAADLRPAVLYVHICGEVKNPGVYELEEGSRIFQAVEMAGGFTEEAAEGYLNMALEVADGMKIVVPSVSDLEGADGPAEDGRTAGMNPEAARRYGLTGEDFLSAGTRETEASDRSGEAGVNLNTAGKEELMTLKGIGEARAEDIIRYREEHGPFQRIEDVMKVSGIKEAAFEKIKDDITV